MTQLKAERACLSAWVGCGFGVPIDLDPTVLSTGLAELNPIRDIANVRTTVLLAEAQFNVDNTKCSRAPAPTSPGGILNIGGTAVSSRRVQTTAPVTPTVRCSAAGLGGQRCRRASRPRGQRLAILGDWSGFTIVDRLVAQIELIHLFGATNRFPTEAARDLVNLASSSGVTKPNALRLICSELLDHLGYLLGTHQPILVDIEGR